jgi:hypothetical protein
MAMNALTHSWFLILAHVGLENYDSTCEAVPREKSRDFELTQ